MTADTPDYDAFARILQNAYREARLHGPEVMPGVEEGL